MLASIDVSLYHSSTRAESNLVIVFAVDIVRTAVVVCRRLSSSVVVIGYYKEVCDSRLKKVRCRWESVFVAGAQPPLGARVGIRGFVWVILLVVQKQLTSPVASPRVASISSRFESGWVGNRVCCRQRIDANAGLKSQYLHKVGAASALKKGSHKD